MQTVNGLLLFLIFIIACCSDKNNVVDNNKGDIIGNTTFKYQYLSTAPYHTQTSMLTKHGNKLYRFGSRVPVQVFDLLTNNWLHITLPDETFAKWDGAAVTFADSIFVVATSGYSRDIIKLDVTTNSFEHTNILLPDGFHYPAYCNYNNQIIFFSLSSDSVYSYNVENRKLIKIAENPFYTSTDFNLTLSSGKYENYFYVFGGFHHLPENLFFRMNLNDFKWEKLEHPDLLAKKNINGASFGCRFILVVDSTTVYEYSLASKEWKVDNSLVPIYTHLPNYTDRGEMSFYAEDTCLYITDIVSDKIWKITK